MEKTRPRSASFKLALLSISLMLQSGGTIAIAVSKMKETFVDHSATAVESLVTAPNITIMIFVLLSTFLVRSLGTKTVVLLGLTIAGISGMVPMITENYTIVYLSRLALGAGLGMYNSLAVSLIDYFYEGELRNKMLGYQTAFQSLGQMIMTFLASQLAVISWQYAYIVYGLALVPVVLFLFFIPTIHTKTEGDEKDKGTIKINSFTILSALGFFFTFAFIMNLYTKATTFVLEANFSNAEFLGTALSLATIVAFICNFLYGNIVKYTKHYTMPISYLILGISFFLISNSSSMFSLTVAIFLASAGAALYTPYSFGILMQKAPRNAANLAVSIGMVGVNLGVFFSPYIMSAISNFFTNQSAAFSMLSSGYVFTGFALSTFFFSKQLRVSEN